VISPRLSALVNRHKWGLSPEATCVQLIHERTSPSPGALEQKCIGLDLSENMKSNWHWMHRSFSQNLGLPKINGARGYVSPLSAPRPPDDRGLSLG
jgi:hypothetical protein